MDKFIDSATFWIVADVVMVFVLAGATFAKTV
jgi:hypothetical protein